jgi:hypothetical protein
MVAVAAWCGLAGLAVGAFARQVTWSGHDIIPKELVAFAYAFSVAGSLIGIAAVASGAGRRWATGFGLLNMAVLAASVPVVRGLIFRLTAPNLAWAGRAWEESIDCMRFGATLGVITGLVGSVFVFSLGLLERRMARWQFGAVAAVVVALLGFWLLPLAIAHLPNLVSNRVGDNYRYLYDEVVRGAGIGAGAGALCGAIVAGLLARSAMGGRKEGRNEAKANSSRALCQQASPRQISNRRYR